MNEPDNAHLGYNAWFRQDMVARNQHRASFAHNFALIYPFFVHDRQLLQWYVPPDPYQDTLTKATRHWQRLCC